MPARIARNIRFFNRNALGAAPAGHFHAGSVGADSFPQDDEAPPRGPDWSGSGRPEERRPAGGNEKGDLSVARPAFPDRHVGQAPAGLLGVPWIGRYLQSPLATKAPQK